MFGRYRVVREIGRGATSCVYLAEDVGGPAGEDSFGQDWSHDAGKPKRVALKVVDFTDDRSKLSRRFRKLFATEAAVTAQFDHPNIAKVYDWKVEDKHAYLVMELVEGTGLDQFVTMDKLLPMHRVVGIVFKVAMALDYAHRRGIVHRDIKPANVMLTKDDEVKLMDFGLALNIRKNVNVDSTFINGLGSPSYMSPEQIKGYTLNHQTDLYSLGVMFYQLLTGRLPFRAPNTAALVYKIINTEAVPVTQLNPDLPELTNKVIVRALEKDLYSRYRLGADMAKDLSAVRFQILEDNVVLPDETKWKAVRALPLLGKLDDVDIWELLRLSAWRKLPPATVIMRDGEEGKSFGFIIDGEVEVEKGDRALAKLARGDIVGEVGFLKSEGGRRTATVTTLNQVTYLEINPAAFAFATEELVAEIRRIAVDALVERMGAADRVARHYSPAAVHPTELPADEAAAPAAGIGIALPTAAPGWSVFQRPGRAPAAPPAAAAPIVVPPRAAPAATPAEPPAPRTATVVVQPLPPAAAAAIAQMALTQHPASARARSAQPFELGPEATGEAPPPLSVSELPADAVLTTELGAKFDNAPEMATTELAGGFAAPGANAATVDLGSPLDMPQIATTEMAADFGRPPPAAEVPELIAPDFDVHARTGRVAMPPRARSYEATTDMAADFSAPAPRRAPVPPAGGSLRPTTRPVADQSTQELASGFFSTPGAAQPGRDPLDQIGSDMFPPIAAAAPDRGGAEEGYEATQLLDPGHLGAPPAPDEGYEATQVFDPARFDTPFPALDEVPEGGDAHPPARRTGHPAPEDAYESTQVLDPGAFDVPALPGHDDGAGGHEVTVEFGAAGGPGGFDRTMELPGGFRDPDAAADEEKATLFPPLKI
ncbi:MAG: protein kinase [Burkholderiales bacterium]|nr:protein kinase [Burkholderiales bacterium]